MHLFQDFEDVQVECFNSLLLSLGDEQAKQEGFKIATVLRALLAVKKSCFGMIREPDWEDRIKQFVAAFLKTSLSVTVKTHIIFVHVAQFLRRNLDGNQGLGRVCEQAAESVHSHFNQLWIKGYKCAANHPQYGKRLLDCTVCFNSRRM